MKRVISLLIFYSLIFCMTTEAQNPLLGKYTNPYEAIPFDKIKTEHFKPAYMEAIKQGKREIDAIVRQRSVPTFENTIEAFEHSGELLSRVSCAFAHLTSCQSNDELMKIETEMSPILTEYSVSIAMNEALFARVKSVYDSKEKRTFTPEQAMLLEDTYKGFIRSGANLQGEDRKRYADLKSELDQLSIQFGQNLIKEVSRFELLINNKSELEGMTEADLETAAMKAKSKDREGWLLDISAPCYIGVMTNCKNRDLRQKMYLAYNLKGNHNDELDNKEILRNIANRRLEIALLLGYPNYAAYALENRMAQTVGQVNNLLDQLLAAYYPKAMQEVSEVMEFANKENGNPISLMPWDFGYYSDKLKTAKYNINNEMLRPYFELSKTIDGVFGLATKLYGITFKESKKLPTYHQDVKVYEVFDKDGSFLSLLYADFHPRDGKQSGAWMTNLKDQSISAKGKNERPHIAIVMNFTKPTTTEPSLLTYNEVETFLHEFGHALHGIFANSSYSSLSGTSVYRDFVELPSQIMENWLSEKEFLDQFAVHYKTGEKLPESLLKNIQEAANYNVAYACIRQLQYGYLDMAWFSIDEPMTGDISSFERKAIEPTHLLRSVDGCITSTAFNHIFGGGYSAGYYSYKWAEVLDADAFGLFKEKGIFNQKVAERFRNEILSKGGSAHPMELYKRFRGHEPQIGSLMRRDGIIK